MHRKISKRHSQYLQGQWRSIGQGEVLFIQAIHDIHTLTWHLKNPITIFSNKTSKVRIGLLFKVFSEDSQLAEMFNTQNCFLTGSESSQVHLSTCQTCLPFHSCAFKLNTFIIPQLDC